jgi:hypothetical protein
MIVVVAPLRESASQKGSIVLVDSAERGAMRTASWSTQAQSGPLHRPADRAYSTGGTSNFAGKTDIRLRHIEIGRTPAMRIPLHRLAKQLGILLTTDSPE